MHHTSHTVWQVPKKNVLCHVTNDTPVTKVNSGKPRSLNPSRNLVAVWGLSNGVNVRMLM
jgi:hypothetical protein